jgi:hypothetical protein
LKTNGAEKVALLILSIPVRAGFCRWIEAKEMSASAFFEMLEAIILNEKYRDEIF